ncbi:MAG: DUF481 domain-containing protein [Planctomycetota bacterium]
MPQLRACTLAVAAALLVTSCRALPDMFDLQRRQTDMNAAPPARDPVPEDDGAVPLGDGKDWMQLKSGEWLRGEFIRLRDEKIDFDSDELDEQSIDFEDVTKIRSPNNEIVVTNDNRIFEGAIVLDGDDFWIVGARTLQFHRSEIQAILAVNEERKQRWEVDLSLGFTVRSGNTDQTDLNSSFNVLRETATTRFTSRYIGVISTVSDVEAANNHRVNAAYDMFVTERLFVTLPGAELFSDRFQNIQLRGIVFTGLGYEIIDSPKQDWRVTLGPAYQFTRLDTVEPGVEPLDQTGAFVFTSNYELEISKNIDLDFDYSITLPVPEAEQYNHNLFLGVDVDLIGNLDLSLTFIWDRVNQPVAGEDGNVPLPDDFRSFIGITWDL